MNGLALARAYHDAHHHALLARYPAQRIAAGLVGFGSECFGFDDALSRDHDFGPGFCLWLTSADFAAFGSDLQAGYDRLPTPFAGVPARTTTARSGQRVGVFAIDDFYSQFLGAPELPISAADWLQIPEELLATAVNGAVFNDPLGQFSHVRQSLLAYYPDNLLRRKLASIVAKMAQSGQYNLPRALQRGELTTALLAQAEFIRHTCNVAYILNRRFAPFYKWLHRGLQTLPLLSTLHAALHQLAQTPLHQSAAQVENICAQLLQTLIAQGYTIAGDSFLESHVDAILHPTLETRHEPH